MFFFIIDQKIHQSKPYDLKDNIQTLWDQHTTMYYHCIYMFPNLAVVNLAWSSILFR